MQCCSFSSVLFFSASCFFVCSFLLCSGCEQGLTLASPPKADNCADGEKKR